MTWATQPAFCRRTLLGGERGLILRLLGCARLANFAQGLLDWLLPWIIDSYGILAFGRHTDAKTLRLYLT
jgi:hypothetical protein